MNNALGPSPEEELFGNWIIQEFWPRFYYDEFSRELDEVCHSVLVRLGKKGFVTRDEICDCSDMVLNTTPFCTEKRVRFMIDFDPTLLMRSALLHYFLDDLKYCPDADLKRFQTLFELGMYYYPAAIGLLFHRDYPWEHACEWPFDCDNSHPFSIACAFFGKEKVTELVDEIISKSTRGRPLAIQNLVFAAATNADILEDGLYFLLRRDPTALVPSIPRTYGTDLSRG